MRYRQHEKVVTRRIAGETLLIPITQIGVDLQRVYLLNETAAAIWALLSEPRDVETVVALLAEAYNAPAQDLRQDVMDTLQEFESRSFLTTVADDV
ncbi:PqqD family protein [bacterium]|nr:PqqD family protein [bacterium]